MYACNWARRVAFTGVASCAVNEPAYVCVAVSQGSLNGCDDGCSGNTDSYNTYQASNSSDEVIILRCPSSGDVVFGPVDESVFSDDHSFSYARCSPSVQPQGRPELCACREQVCDAVEGL